MLSPSLPTCCWLKVLPGAEVQLWYYELAISFGLLWPIEGGNFESANAPRGHVALLGLPPRSTLKSLFPLRDY